MKKTAGDLKRFKKRKAGKQPACIGEKRVTMYGQEVTVKVYAKHVADAPPIYVVKGGEKVLGISGGGTGFLHDVREDPHWRR